MSQTSKRELLSEVRPRYILGNRTVKRRILDELVAITGYHRKYAIQMLNHPPKRRTRQRRPGQLVYGGRVPAALEQVCRAANCICGKRLVPAMAQFVVALADGVCRDYNNQHVADVLQECALRLSRASVRRSRSPLAGVSASQQ